MIAIDVRTIPPRERHPAIFTAFDGLPPGEAILLVNNHDPKPLLLTFQRERRGLYDWAYLEDGPERWQIRIGRRPALRESASSVSDLLGADHDRLDELMKAVRHQWSEEKLEEAEALFAAFATGLRRHIRSEEEVLFPAFEALTGHGPHFGPTAVMRAEHVEIESALVAITDALAKRAADEPREVGGLLSMLMAHNRKEEHVLYPMTDSALETAERAALVDEIEAA